MQSDIAFTQLLCKEIVLFLLQVCLRVCGVTCVGRTRVCFRV